MGSRSCKTPGIQGTGFWGIVSDGLARADICYALWAGAFRVEDGRWDGCCGRTNDFVSACYGTRHPMDVDGPWHRYSVALEVRFVRDPGVCIHIARLHLRTAVGTCSECCTIATSVCNGC